jgi:hypothetical protein
VQACCIRRLDGVGHPLQYKRNASADATKIGDTLVLEEGHLLDPPRKTTFQAR